MPGHRPKFSICIPCFNHAAYIGTTIQSVLDQSFEDFEIIIADNVSTDDSLSVVRSFRDPRLRVIENRYNIGFAPNLQRVTETARGEYLNLLSSDDVMEREALATYAQIIETAGEDRPLVLMSQCWQIDGDGQVTAYITRRGANLAPCRSIVPAREDIEQQDHYDVMDGRTVYEQCMADMNTAGVFCSLTYSRQLWLDVEGYNSTQIMNPDMHFAVKLLRQNPGVVYVNRPLYRYRRHQMGQAAQQSRQGALKLQVDIYKYTLEFDDNWLQSLDTTREDQQALFVERDCVKVAFMKLADWKWLDATRLMAFGWATYPLQMLRIPLAWFVAMLLLLGPSGAAIAVGLWWMHRRRKPALRSLAATTRAGLVL